MNNARLLFVHALSPLHAGTGQGVGVIDLPIAREKATDLPFLPGSSIKGTLRDSCANSSDRKKVFGPDTDQADEHAGSAQFADARLLLLPVRSLAGTFAWVTSPYILHRFQRDAGDAGAVGLPTAIPVIDAALQEPERQCRVALEGSRICLAGATPLQVCLEDLDLDAVADAAVTAWAQWIGDRVFLPGEAAWQTLLAERFCVVHDDVLTFLLQTATEITARIKMLADKKTVQKGGLWYEEALPAETILASLVVATPVKAAGVNSADDVFAILEELTGKTMQLGGKATVGRGLCRVRLA